MLRSSSISFRIIILLPFLQRLHGLVGDFTPAKRTVDEAQVRARAIPRRSHIVIGSALLSCYHRIAAIRRVLLDAPASLNFWLLKLQVSQRGW